MSVAIVDDSMFQMCVYIFLSNNVSNNVFNKAVIKDSRIEVKRCSFVLRA